MTSTDLFCLLSRVIGQLYGFFLYSPLKIKVLNCALLWIVCNGKYCIRNTARTRYNKPVKVGKILHVGMVLEANIALSFASRCITLSTASLCNISHSALAAVL